MRRRISDDQPYSRGGLFRRLVLPLVLLTLIAVFYSLYNARRIESERHRARLASIASSNAQLLEKISLPRSARLAEDLSTTAGVTIVLAESHKKLTSATALDGAQQELAWKTLASPGEVIEHRGHQAIAFTIGGLPKGHLIALESVPHGSLFEKSNLVPALLSSLILALGAAFIISRSAVRPLGKLVSAIRDTPVDKELHLPSRLLEQRDEIGILTRELVSSRQQLIDEQHKRQRAEWLAMLGQLTTSLAHEIKNPAASIIMHGQALQKHQSNEVGALIVEEGEQIASLVDQWLFVAKPEGTKYTDNDLAALLKHLLKKLQPLFEFHAITIVADFPDQLMCCCDAHRMELVLRNLLINSVHAMPEGGTITLDMHDEGERLCFSVLDQGKGFSDEALEHFGEAFYSEREGGLGLGLTLVKEVVTAHGGEVVASNADHGGALVSAWLPKTNSPTSRR